MKYLLVLLPGALGVGEISWKVITRLGRKRRVVCPSYAPLPTAAELVDGIAELLTHLGVEASAMLGGSYGGYVAQLYVRRHPQSLDKLVVSHAGPPDAERGKELERWIARLYRMPMALLRAVVKRSLSALLPEEHPEVALVEAQVNEILATRLSKEDVISMYVRAVDLFTNYTFTPHDLDDWAGKMLLIMSDNDPSTPAEAREEMRRLYPQAQVYLFSGTGHVSSLLRQQRYLAVVEEFLEGE